MKTYLLATFLLHVGILHLVDAECKPSVTKVGGSAAKTSPICSGEMIFSEDFNSLNDKVWNHEIRSDGGGNGEFQDYVNDREISFAKDSKLYIVPKIVGDKRAPDGSFKPIQSARLTTAGHFNFKYGKLEARARIPAGDWLWPAIWMMPQDSKYGTWPRSGEIDILESRGNKNLVAWGGNIGTQLVFSTLHWGKSSGENQFQRTHYEKRRSDGYDSDYHTYMLEWTPDFIAFRVDNEEIGRIAPPNGGFYQVGQLSGDNPWGHGSKMAPFDENFFVIVNLAIGATNGYFPDEGTNPGGKPWKNSSPQAAKDFWNGNGQWRPTWNEKNPEQRSLKVDYIRVWAL